MVRGRYASGTAHKLGAGDAGYRGLWQAGEALLRELDLPQPFSLSAQCDAVRQARGRPLIVLPLPLPASDESPYGLWVDFPDADFILHEAGTSPAHRDQIILHEIAHILLGHGAAASFRGASRRAGRGLVSELGTEQPAAVMTRHAYGSTEERHAEIVASLLMGRTQEVSLPAAFAASLSVHDYRALRALRPLWSALTTAVPHIVLGALPHGSGDPVVMGAALRFRLGRRIVEIRDAALLLRSYVSDVSAASARARIAAGGLTGEELNAAAEAAWLRAACAARRGGCPPVHPASIRPLRGGDDLTSEAKWLRLVAAAWNHPATVLAATEIRDLDL